MRKKFSISAGYTFIELLVVIAILGIIGSLGTVAFISFNNNQVVEAAMSDVASTYTIARQRTISQIKPAVCSDTQIFRGYVVSTSIASGTYGVSVRCGSATSAIPSLSKKLPTGVSFGAGTPATAIFEAPNGTFYSDAEKTVTVTGYGKTKSIILRLSGTISVL